MASGKVKWWDNKKGFGFIAQDSGQDVFVHHTSIVGKGFKTLNEGDEVAFDIVASDKGPKAETFSASGRTSCELSCPVRMAVPRVSLRCVPSPGDAVRNMAPKTFG